MENDRRRLYVLDTFTGIGGGILGALLCGHRIMCAVELDPYCRSVLVRRQNDGHLPHFPIWDDVRTFDGRRWRGIVDVVSGGFPCQNISPAGDRTGITGEKSSLWFTMLRIVREIRPRYVFVENSAQLVRNGLDVVLEGLDTCGYDAEWCVLGADDVGANHRRKRCWILGRNSNYKTKSKIGEVAGEKQVGGGICTNVPNTGNDRTIEWQWELQGNKQVTGDGEDNGRRTPFNALGKWWKVEPGVGRVVDECPHRLERLKGLGNAQVPLCAAVAWKTLYERINEI